MTKYEYKIVEQYYLDLAMLNDLGNQGWKMVASSGNMVYFMKEVVRPYTRDIPASLL